MRRIRILSTLAVLLLASGATSGLAGGHENFEERLNAAIAAPDRPEKDKARDANRLPKATLAFFRIDRDQRVLELLPGGGWYSRLLAPALDGTGKLYLAFTQRTPMALLESELMKNVEILDLDAPFGKTEHRGIFRVEPFDFGVRDLDAVLTFRNLHNLTAESRANMNVAAFAALRPGGVYGVIDHSRRHNEPDEARNWRRLDPVLVIQEVQAAGFVFEDASPLHYRPGDPLLEEVGHESVTGRTDRFALRFRKPRAD